MMTLKPLFDCDPVGKTAELRWLDNKATCFNVIFGTVPLLCSTNTPRLAMNGVYQQLNSVNLNWFVA